MSVALLALLTVVAAAGWIRERGSAAAPLPETRLEITTPETSDPISFVSFAISPDGRRIVFVASGESGQSQLWLRPLDRTTAEPVAGTEGAIYPFWSPDSRSVAFFAGRSLKRLDLGSGLPQTLANAPSARGGSWGPDGVIVFAPSSTGPLFRVSASGGEAVVLTAVAAGHFFHGFPQFLPDSRQFFLTVGGGQGLHLGSLDTPETIRLTDASSTGAFVPPD